MWCLFFFRLAASAALRGSKDDDDAPPPPPPPSTNVSLFCHMNSAMYSIHETSFPFKAFSNIRLLLRLRRFSRSIYLFVLSF